MTAISSSENSGVHTVIFTIAMSSPPSRLKNILGHLLSSHAKDEHAPEPVTHIHQLSPTFFLERAATIEPDAEAIVHTTSNDKLLRRTYREFADVRLPSPNKLNMQSQWCYCNETVLTFNLRELADLGTI